MVRGSVQVQNTPASLESLWIHMRNRVNNFAFIYPLFNTNLQNHKVREVIREGQRLTLPLVLTIRTRETRKTCDRSTKRDESYRTFFHNIHKLVQNVIHLCIFTVSSPSSCNVFFIKISTKPTAQE